MKTGVRAIKKYGHTMVKNRTIFHEFTQCVIFFITTYLLLYFKSKYSQSMSMFFPYDKNSSVALI
jgi:hypothetical protein